MNTNPSQSAFFKGDVNPFRQGRIEVMREFLPLEKGGQEEF
jgi:hypothetical protein